MIIRMLNVMLMLCISPLLWGQGKIVYEEVVYFNDTIPFEQHTISRTRFFEVENIRPVYDFVTDSSRVGKKNYIVYHFDNTSQKVSTGVVYKGGFDKFQQYQDSLYWRFYNGMEMNVTCWYTLLFDKQLNIKEVKIVRRNGYNNSRYNFDQLIKRILLSTEGNWRIDNSMCIESDSICSEYYFMPGIFRLR